MSAQVSIMSSRAHQQSNLVFHVLIQPVQFIQPIQHQFFRRFLNLSCQKHLIQNCVNFEEVEHQVQFTHITKVGIENLHKQVNGL